MNTKCQELYLELEDREWPYEYTDHERQIARAIVFDEDGKYYFVRVNRDDDFGKGSFIETSGGGIEANETPEAAICRELREELGAEVRIVCKLGTVNDYYNAIHRHNINHYFLCRVLSFGETSLTEQEQEDFHLSTLKLSFSEAVSEYRHCTEMRLGRLLAARELPVLQRAEEIRQGL